jgi:hypothetical protein
MPGHRRTRAHLRTALIEGPISAAAADQTLRSTFGGRWVWPLGGVERPRRKERCARSTDRRGRAFGRPSAGAASRRQSQPDLVVTQGGAARVAHP